MAKGIDRIKELEPGVYDAGELKQKLGLKCGAMVKKLMIAYGAFVERVPCGDRNQNVKLIFYREGVK